MSLLNIEKSKDPSNSCLDASQNTTIFCAHLESFHRRSSIDVKNWKALYVTCFRTASKIFNMELGIYIQKEVDELPSDCHCGGHLKRGSVFKRSKGFQLVDFSKTFSKCQNGVVSELCRFEQTAKHILSTHNVAIHVSSNALGGTILTLSPLPFTKAFITRVGKECKEL